MSNSSTDFMNRAMALLDKDNAETQKKSRVKSSYVKNNC